MPTPAHRPYLDRKKAVAAGQPALRVASPALTEGVNYATKVAHRCIEAAPPSGPDVHLAPVLLFFHAIELADGIQVMLDHSCSRAAQPLARSLFETAVYLEFICRGDDQRSLAWLVWVNQTKKKHIEILNPLTKSRKKKGRVSKVERQHAAQAKKEAKEIEQLLDQDHLKAVVEKLHGAATWYQPFGGGTSLEQLASHLDAQFREWYQVLYRHRSTATHGMTAARLTVEDDGAALWPIRDPRHHEMKQMAALSLGLLVICVKAMSVRYLPGDDATKQWYRSEMCEPFDWLVRG